MTIHQGNIITEDMVDRLEPGMTRNQVRYLLGTPMLVDIFHGDHWCLPTPSARPTRRWRKTPLVVHFEGDLMTRVDGFLTPNPARAAGREPEEVIVEVPDWQGDAGMVQKTLKALGVEDHE